MYARLGVELAIDRDEVWPEKKYRAGEKAPASKIAVGPPIPIYIASDRIPRSTRRVWGSLKLAPTKNYWK